jgi:hypothetical protein
MTGTPRLIMAGAAAAAAISLSGYLAAPAGAAHSGAVSSRSESVSYARTMTFNSRPTGRCVTFTFTGTFKYTFSASSKSSNWTHQRLAHPELQAMVRKFAHGKCGASAKLSAVQLDQFVAGAKCGFNPAMTVTKPWRLTVADWAGCGNRRQAGNVSPKIRRSSSAYVLISPGTRVRFATFSEPGRPANPPCYAFQAAGTIYNGSISDSFSDFSKKVCLSKT